ncbi:MAG TPA: dockerin type I domain-containing protein, partial [Chthoniobacterales bacterium]
TPEGLPNETVGLSSTSGYTTANGTSFSGPVTAGAMALVRQRVREELNLDTTNLADPQYRTKRFDTVTVARALLQNSATNLRSGLGSPQGDGPSSVASINDMGSGHINIAGALTANAIMVAPTALLTEPREYTTATPPASPLQALIPTSSFGEVPVVNVNGIVTRTREVIIRDVKGGAGAGSYNLTVVDNRLPASGFGISFTSDAAGNTPVTSVNVPAGGQASFFVRTAADGTQITINPTEIMWYVTATAAGSGQTMRMPFYYRAVSATVPNITAPLQLAPTGTEGTAGSCAGDTNGSFTLAYTYTAPGTGGPAPVGFRIQEGTRSDAVFFDDADEPLVAGANSKWTGSQQWNSQVNPGTGSVSYFIPDAANQNEALTMVTAVALPPGGATLSFDTTQDTEQDFDFANVDVSADGVNFTTVASYSGAFAGTRFIDISGYAGGSVKVRFRMTSDLVGSAPGWFVENIRISSDDFRTIANTPAATTSLNVNGRTNGTYTYRVAGLFANPNPMEPGTTVIGPYSNLTCVTVNSPLQVTGAGSRKTHAGTTLDVELPLVSSVGIESRRGGSAGSHQVVFRFPAAVNTSGATATAVSETGGTATVSGSPVASGDGREVAVNLTGVSDAQRLRVTLIGISNGTNIGDVGVSMGILLGDTNQDGTVNSGDGQQTRSRSGQLASGDNFRSDVNTDGTVNSGDAFIVRGRSGTAIP